MRVVDEISGSGGGGKAGGGSSFTQTPDNLRSEDLFEGLLGLGQGPWKGPVNGLQSVFLDDTPLEDPNGTVNFPEWIGAFANGDPTLHPQKPTLKLGNAASVVSIGVDLANTTGTGVPVVRTVPNLGAQAIDLRFVVQQLYHQTKKGVFNQTMTIQVRMRPNGASTWIEVLVDTTATEPSYDIDGKDAGGGVRAYISRSFYDGAGNRTSSGGTSGRLTITGKTTAPYVKEIRISVPDSGDYANKAWDIECTLMEKDSYDNDPDFDKRQVQWESAAAVYTDVNLGSAEAWRGLAWLSLYGVASDRISGLPKVSSICDTKIVSVPPSGVFDPERRTYTSTLWDGSYIKAYTRDPAWVIADAISDPLAGVANIAPGAYLNKWDALELSKHCSTMVPDGDIGQADWVAGVATVVKSNARAAVLTNVNTASPGSSLGGVTMAASDRVVLAGQTTASQNGLYVWNGSSSAMTRVTDMDASSEFIGALVYVTEGTNKERWFKICQAVTTVGTTAVKWVSVHPRYSMNYSLENPQKADEFIKTLAGAVNAIAWDAGNSEWRAKIERAETPLAIFTEENIQGEFVYSHTDVDTRYNDITMTFQNEDFSFREDRVRVPDYADIAINGRRPVSLVAIGCTNRQEAYRRAYLRVLTSLNEFRLVNFTTNRQGRYLERLGTILVADKSLGYVAPTGATDTFPNKDIATWSGTAGVVTNSDGSYTVTDSNNVGSDNRAITLSSMTLNQQYTFSIRVKKDAIGKATRIIAFRMIVDGFIYDAQLDTSTGEIGSSDGEIFGVKDDGDHWLLYQTLTPTASTSVTFRLFSAFSSGSGALPLTSNSTLIASATFSSPQLYEGSFVPDDLRQYHTTGRLIAIDGPRTTLTLRDPLRLEPGATYTIVASYPNPNYTPSPATEPTNVDWDKPTITATYNVSSSSPRGDVTSIVVTSALHASIPNNAVVALNATGLPTLPKTYRITDLNLDADGERVTVSAIEVDTGKWDAADNVDGAALEKQSSDPTTPVPIAPATGILNLLTFPSDFGTQRVLEIDWERPGSKFISGYEVWYKFNDGPRTYLNTTSDTRIEIPDPYFGTYAVEIYSIDRRAQKSVPLKASIEVLEVATMASVGYLTNESQTVPVNSSGTVTSYAAATGSFKVNVGTVDVTSACTFSIVANPQTLTASIDAAGVYTITGGFDASETVATLTLRAYHAATNSEVLKVFTLSKSNGPVISVSAPVQAFTFTDNQPDPASQSITVTATLANTSETINWTTVPSGLALTGSGNSRTLSVASIGESREVRIVATGATSGVSDVFTVVRLDRGDTNAFVPRKTWPFTSSLESWTGNGATAVLSGGIVSVTSPGVDWHYRSPGSLAMVGSSNYIVRARVRASVPNQQWEGICYYATGGHAYSNSYRKILAEPVGWDSQQWCTIEFDMSKLSAGGTDYVDNTINQLRLDITNDAVSVDLDWVTIGDLSADLLIARAVEDGADVTAFHAAVGDGNRVRYSLFEKGQIGWKTLTDSASLTETITTGYDATQAKYYLQSAFTFGAASQSMGVGNDHASFGYQIPVYPGERVFAAIQAGVTAPASSTYEWRIGFEKQDGTLVSNTVITSGSVPAWPTRLTTFVTVPVLAVSMWMELRVISGGSGAATIKIGEYMVCSAGSTQAAIPVFAPGPSSDPAADVTTQVTGPLSGNINYDSTGATIEANVDFFYSLQAYGGSLTSGVTAKYRVVDGTVNGFAYANGYQTLTPVSGVSTLTVSAMTTATATLEIALTYGGVTRTQNLVLTKVLAAPAASSGGTYAQSQTSGFVSLNSAYSTFANLITDRLQITMPTGKTTCNININLSPKWSPKSGAVVHGPWNIEFKIQRNTGTTGSPTWTDIGTTQNSNPDPLVETLDDPPTTISAPGTMSYSFNDTGRTAGQTYEYRVLARISSGSTTGNTGGILYTGSVALTAP